MNPNTDSKKYETINNSSRSRLKEPSILLPKYSLENFHQKINFQKQYDQRMKLNKDKGLYDIDKMIHQQLPGGMFLLNYASTKDRVSHHKQKLVMKQNLKML